MKNSQLIDKQLLKTLAIENMNMSFRCNLSMRSIHRDGLGHLATAGCAA